MSKKILCLTFYYPPDLCAGSFRAGALVNALREVHGSKLQIEVLTTMPNRYQSFQRFAEQLEVTPGVEVHRFQIHAHKSGFVDQSQSFLSYARQVLSRVRGRHYDLVYATSSRLMTASLGAYVAKRLRAPLYLDIRDLFTDTMSDVLSGRVRWLFLPLFRLLEKYTFQTAAAINVVSPGFRQYFASRGYGDLLRFYTNGIDDEFLKYNFSRTGELRERLVILYAGNIGAGQGLHRVIPDAARLLQKTHSFRVVGDGGAKTALMDSCAGLGNVQIELPVDRERLKELYSQADILLMHLNDYDAFRKVLPSKIFEYAATGKPILAGVAGYAAEFVRERIDNAAVFTPCDGEGLAAALDTLHADPVTRSSFRSDYARARIMQSFAEDVVCLLPEVEAGLDGL